MGRQDATGGPEENRGERGPAPKAAQGQAVADPLEGDQQHKCGHRPRPRLGNQRGKPALAGEQHEVDAMALGLRERDRQPRND